MAISFLQVPDTVTSGFNPMNFVVSSTQSHQTGFRYNVEVIDWDGNTMASFVQLKQPTYGNLLFDAQRTVERYLSYDNSHIISGSTNWKINSDYTRKRYKVKVIEEYPRLSFHASGESSYIYAINSAMNWQDYVNFGLGGRIASNSTRKWMTDQPERIAIREDDRYELGTICSALNVVSYLKIETYDSGHNLLKTATRINSESAGTDTRFVLSILCGPDDLNNTTLSSGTQPLIEDNTAYYRVACFDVVDTQSTEWKYFDIDRSCTRDGTYARLFWLNPLGRFDAYNFNFMKDDSIEVDKAKYQRLLGTMNSPSSFTYSTHQQETSVFHSTVRQKYKLRSGYIDTDTSEWLKELIASPLVYMIIPINTGDTFVAVTIDNTNYQAKNTAVEKLFNVDIDVTLSTISQRQRL